MRASSITAALLCCVLAACGDPAPDIAPADASEQAFLAGAEQMLPPQQPEQEDPAGETAGPDAVSRRDREDGRARP